MTRLLPFRFPVGERAMFSRIIINALEQSLSFKAVLMSCGMCSDKVFAIGPQKAKHTRFLKRFHPSVIPFIKYAEGDM